MVEWKKYEKYGPNTDMAYLGDQIIGEVSVGRDGTVMVCQIRLDPDGSIRGYNHQYKYSKEEAMKLIESTIQPQ